MILLLFPVVLQYKGRVRAISLASVELLSVYIRGGSRSNTNTILEWPRIFISDANNNSNVLHGVHVVDTESNHSSDTVNPLVTDTNE